MSMRVCVIGGTGNISSAIVDQLVARGDEVTVVARRGSEHLRRLGVRQLAADRSARDEFELLLRREAFDAVIDMITYDSEDARSTLRAVGRSGAHLVLCSTVCALGVKVERLPTPPDEPYRPVAAYGEGKRDAEQYLCEVGQEGLVPVTIIRPSHTYGRMPLVRQLGMDPCYLDRLRKGLPIIVTGNAEGLLWQSTDRRDVAAVFVACLGRTRCFGEIYHAVGDEVFSWADHHRATAAALGCPAPELVAVPRERILAADEGGRTEVFRTITGHTGWYDNSKTKRDLPEVGQTVSFREGIVANVEWADSEGLNRPAGDDLWEDRLLEAWRQEQLSCVLQ